MAKKRKTGVEIVGLDELIESLERFGEDVSKVADKALIQTKEYINQNLISAMNSSRFDFDSRSGNTRKSLDQDKRTEHGDGQVSILAGYDIANGGIASIMLMYGTPTITPDRKLYAAVFGAKTKKEVAEIQGEVFQNALREVELK